MLKRMWIAVNGVVNHRIAILRRTWIADNVRLHLLSAHLPSYSCRATEIESSVNDIIVITLPAHINLISDK
jgi:hypothetical protein